MRAADADLANHTLVRQATIDPQPITFPILDKTDIRFMRPSAAEGVAHTKVDHIVQDDQGFIWFGTPYGLNRFDGYTFTAFVPAPGTSTGLSGVVISALFKDRDGTLWVGCDQSLNRFDRATETFTKYPVPSVRHISQDSSGALWFGTPTGLYSLEPVTGRIRHYTHAPDDPSSLGSDDVQSSGEDKDGRFWIANTEGLDEFDRTTGRVRLHIPLHGFSFYEDRFGVFWIFRFSPDHPLAVFDRKTNRITNYSLQEPDPVGTALTGVTAMLEDRDGALWVATRGTGLLTFDREHQRFIRYRHHPADRDSLPQNNVETIFADREGAIWAGLGRMGPIRFTTDPLPFSRPLDDRNSATGVREPFVGAMYEDRQGTLWIGTPDALKRIDRAAGQATSYRRIAGPAAATDVIAINEDGAGNLWIGTYGHGLLRFDRRTGQFTTYTHRRADPYSLSNDTVWRLLVDRHGTLWAATDDGLNRFDATTGRFTSYRAGLPERGPHFLALVEDHSGALWLGTHSSGLYRFDSAAGQFTTYFQHDANRPGTLSDNRVNSVHFDASGTMWVGTQNGLNRLDPDTRTFTVYTTRDGLPGNAVGCILEDERGDLWMSTNDGVATLNPHSLRITHYSTADGLPGPDLTGWGACFNSPSGEMFFGGSSGATAFFPGSVVVPSFAPPIVLTDVRVSGSPSGISTPPLALVLRHDQNIFSLTFAALSYSDPATNRYRYKLEGLQQDWTEVSADVRQATYTTLPPGRYTFRAQGATSHGPWSDPGVALRIEIQPPWWAAGWFQTAAATAAAGVLWALYLLRLRRLSARMQLRFEEQERTEAALRASARDLRLTVDSIPGFIFTITAARDVELANHTLLSYTGTTLEEFRNWPAILHADDLPLFESQLSRSFDTDSPFEADVRIRRADGIYRWFHCRGLPLRDADGRALSWYTLLTDIEDRKRAEEALHRTEMRLSRAAQTATVGALAAAIAHEVNQPLAAVVANGHACLRWLSAEPANLMKAQEAAERIVRDGKDAGEVVRHVRSLFKRATLETVMLDLNQVIGEVVHLLSSEAARRHVAVARELGEDVPPVVGDRVQVQHLVFNLLLNGLEAMDPVADRSKALLIRSMRQGAEQVLVEVRDAGVGLRDPDRVFDAFFTTKETGLGMGLAICRSIVEAHHGRLWAVRNDGPGTTFCFTLPLNPVAIDEMPSSQHSGVRSHT